MRVTNLAGTILAFHWPLATRAPIPQDQMHGMLNKFRREPKAPPPPERTSKAFSDSLDAFGSEDSIVFGGRPPADSEPAEEVKPESAQRFKTPDLKMVLGALLILGVAISAFLLRNWRPLQVEAASASLTIESVPAGADVLLKGVSQGKTPLTLSVTPGEHDFELVYGERRKPLRAAARAGAAVVHHVEFESDGALAPKKTSLRITTEPTKLRVSVDGIARGTSPLTIDEIAAGSHRIQVFASNGTIERKVEVAAGESAAVIISAPARASAPSGPAAGWLTVSAPVTMQIVDDSGVVGTSASTRIMLPAGRHNLRIVNDAIGYSERRTVQVSPGSRTSIKVDLPTAPLSINAQPWAEVWVDGKRLGETPIGNHQVRIGPHDIVFRHPELGERKQSVMVTLKSPARVWVDMRKP